MNTNIVAYLIKTKGMTQTDIATKLKSADKDTLGVSQALVSKWNRGEKIPKDREIEMLKLADLFWELEDKYTEDDDFLFDQESLIDSRWNIIVKTEKNQEDWYDFFTDMLSPKKFNNIDMKYDDNDFLKFARQCVFELNSAGFDIPENPIIIKNDTNTKFFSLIRVWMHRITTLQSWCVGTFPRSKSIQKMLIDLYSKLPCIALAQTSQAYEVAEKCDKGLLKNYVNDADQYVTLTAESAFHWQAMMMETYFGQDDFNEILIYPNNEDKEELSQSSSQIESNSSEGIDDSYLSYAERKILDQLNAHEKLIQELNQKIDLLIDQNNESDGIPF
jgi:hypothetical protein